MAKKTTTKKKVAKTMPTFPLIERHAEALSLLEQQLARIFRAICELTYMGKLSWHQSSERSFQTTLATNDLSVSLVYDQDAAEDGEQQDCYRLVLQDNGREPLPALKEFGNGSDLGCFYRELAHCQNNPLPTNEILGRLAGWEDRLDQLIHANVDDTETAAE